MEYQKKLDDIERRFEELTAQMADNAVISDSALYRKISKQQSDMADVVAKWSPSLHAPFPILSNENSQIANDVCGGDSHCQLIVDPTGTIRWGSLNDNWRTLTPPDAVLQSAWRLR